MGRNKVFCEKKEIVDIAFGIVNNEGFNALSTRRLAKEMNVSFMTFYNYVKNIDEIKKEVILEGFNRLYGTAYQSLKNARIELGSLRMEDGCRILARQIFDFAFTYPGIYQLMFTNESKFRNDPEIAPFHGYFAQLLKKKEKGKRDQQFNKALHMFNFVVLGLIMEKLTGVRNYSAKEFDDYVDEYIEKMFTSECK